MPNNFESIRNSKVLLRCDFNEKIENGKLESTHRIDANANSIQELLARNNKIILISHHSNHEVSMQIIFNYLFQIFGDKISFIAETEVKNISKFLENNSNILTPIILLENTRMLNNGSSEEGESLDEKCDLGLSKFFASLADTFVFDAFSVAHREHSSTTGVANLLPSSLGPVAMRELSNLSKILNELDETLLILGGSKLSTKLELLRKFVLSGAVTCVGGAMLHPILLHEGIDIKSSYIEETNLTSNDLEIFESNKSKLIFPNSKTWSDDGKRIVDSIFKISELENLLKQNPKIKNILWNGPVGLYEEGYTEGSLNIAKFVSGHTKGTEHKFTIVGGGDTIAFLDKVNEKDYTSDYSYISLSGGAMLDFLTRGTLPIFEIIKNKKI
jgi:phosphoglycerate kinase